LSRDPEEGTLTDPKTLHEYLYADGDPVNVIDPRGREASKFPTSTPNCLDQAGKGRWVFERL
jgi:hypothetical protein